MYLGTRAASGAHMLALRFVLADQVCWQRSRRHGLRRCIMLICYEPSVGHVDLDATPTEDDYVSSLVVQVTSAGVAFGLEATLAP